MESKPNVRVAVVVIALLAVLILAAYPKERVRGGLRGGPIGPGESAYREDYRCLGIPYDFCPNWPDYGCDSLCFGIVTGRVCSVETYDPDHGLVRTPAECGEPACAFYRLPR